ncbi:MAG: Rrf2 family transcriptional regulator [Candidatus Krumholzibacteria bacterium]|nr:Rrf2 family transcriptional regulator [Candidatus Krumholzibacteria bacterium]
MLSQTVEYALRAVVALANENGRPMVTANLAKITDVPMGYLYKVLQQLGRSDLVVSQRGSKGGFTLHKKPEDITLLEVINAVDPFKRIHRCPMDQIQEVDVLCPLHHRLDEAMGALQEAFATTTIDELLCDPERPYPLCMAQHDESDESEAPEAGEAGGAGT